MVFDEGMEARFAELGAGKLLPRAPGVRFGVAGKELDAEGAAYALASGAITSGLGYAVWYAALRGLSPQAAGSSQLAVPVITAVAGLVLLDEAIGLRLVLGSLAVLGGIALTLPWRRSAA